MYSSSLQRDKKTALVIAAAGSSSRMGGSVKKEYLPFSEGTVLSECAKKFFTSVELSSVIVTVPVGGSSCAESAFYADSCIGNLAGEIPVSFVDGGDTRQKSVLNALEFIEKNYPDTVFVMIHDGARPFVSADVIRRTFAAAVESGAAVPGIQPVDTQKIIDGKGFIKEHLTRSSMAAVQTPQVFRFEKLIEAHRKAAAENTEYTDDTEIWGKFCGGVKVVEGSALNRKITYSQDYSPDGKNMILRTGLGYDLHRLTEGRKLIIGGVEIPFEKGEDGHSDGDTLLHAITDALLGASAMGDIGSFFPPEDDRWKGASSVMLLRTVWDKIRGQGWKLNNLDCVIKLERPKFLPYRNLVIQSVAGILEVSESCVFVKAKTGEKLDCVGRGEAIEVWCSCLLTK